MMRRPAPLSEMPCPTKYPAAVRPRATRSAAATDEKRREVTDWGRPGMDNSYLTFGAGVGFFVTRWVRVVVDWFLGVYVCCGTVRVMIGGAVGVGGGLVVSFEGGLVSVEGGLVSGVGGLVVPGGLVPGGFLTGRGVTVG